MGLGDQPPDFGPLPSGTLKWAKWVVRELVDIRQRYNSLTGNSSAQGQGATTTAMGLQQQVNAIKEALEAAKGALSATQEIVAQLAAAGSVAYDSFDDSLGMTGFTGFYSGVAAQVVVPTPSGRMEVGYGGSLNGGNGYFNYSIRDSNGNVLVSRDDIQFDFAQRVAVSGGASFAPSGYRSTVIENLPLNEPLTIRLEPYAAGPIVFFMGGSILARPTL